MKYPENDVALTGNGDGFVVEDTEYQVHLAESIEIKQVCALVLVDCDCLITIGIPQKPKCNIHRAMKNANVNCENDRDVTGVGACACGCHGCFVPHSMVDFQKGER
jgi:hypothetical protein